jgi:hypothetical protein
MKKKWWILPVALLAVFGLLFVGCGGGSGGDDDDDDDDVVGGGDAVNVVEFTLSQDWSGIDLQDSKFEFAEGDKISGKGKVTAGTPADAEFVFNDKPGAWGTPLYQLTSAPGKDWSFDKTLTATMVANIALGSPKGIRISGNNCDADSFKFTIEELKIERGTTVLLDLGPHLQTFNVGDSNMGLIVPGSMGFQNAGTVTAKIIAKP